MLTKALWKLRRSRATLRFRELVDAAVVRGRGSVSTGPQRCSATELKDDEGRIYPRTAWPTLLQTHFEALYADAHQAPQHLWHAVKDFVPFSGGELASVFQDLAYRHPNASPGEQDMPYQFYAQAPAGVHDALALELTARIQQPWQSPLTTAEMAMSEKRQHPQGLRDYRPLVLLGSLWQGQDAALQQRQQEAMDADVGPQVMGFRKGYQASEMTTVVSLALERCKEWKEPLVLMKVDIEGAFDAVRWDEALQATAAAGIAADAHAMVREQASTPGVAMLDGATASFTKQRGVWQGATSSPRIFRSVKEKA